VIGVLHDERRERDFALLCGQRKYGARAGGQHLSLLLEKHCSWLSAHRQGMENENGKRLSTRSKQIMSLSTALALRIFVRSFLSQRAFYYLHAADGRKDRKLHRFPFELRHCVVF
jgi:hypothetical protein